MSRISYFILSLLSLALVAGACGTSEQAETTGESISNPVLPGDRPDPTVMKVGDTYWASATSNEWAPLFPIFKSDDLQQWQLVSYVFPDGAPSWAEKNFWAPELAYDEEQQKVYAYYTARDAETGRLSVAVASADQPSGPYTDHGVLVSQEAGSIDAYEVRDKDGTLYLLWKEDGNSRGEPTPMWAQQISEDRTRLMGEKHELFRNTEQWEQFLVEGISVFRENDYFYATYSAGSCCDVQCNYKTGVARARNLLGPWEKYEGNPVLTDNSDWKCLGHGSVVRKGGELYFLYHAYSREGSVYVGREAVLERIRWTDDGWPVFQNEARYTRSRESWNFTDTFQGDLNPLWQWRVTQDIRYRTGPDGLMLQASDKNQALGTLLVQPTSSPNYVISTTIGLDATEPGTRAGVGLIGGADNSFGAPVAGIGISAGKGSVQLWKTVNKERTVLASRALASGADSVSLRMNVDQGHKLTFWVNRGEQWQMIGDTVDAAPLVPWGMGFRFGLVAQGDSGRYANFRQVRLRNQSAEQQ